MKVLVACEYSGTVRDAFAAKGHDAWSCDFEPPETNGNHYQCDVTLLLNLGWDLMIAHPPCERLCVSGAKWKYIKPTWEGEQEEALKFVRALLEAPIPKIALENPVGIISSRIRKPDQIIQPYYFGEESTKTTCLWLKNLPKLQHFSEVDLFNDTITHVGKGERHITKSGKSLPKWYNLPPSPDRKKLRAFRYKCIAKAMAEQWG